LISSRDEQIRKASGFLKSLKLPTCSTVLSSRLAKLITQPMYSLLLDDHSEVLYQGFGPAFMDEDLIQMIKKYRSQSCVFYLNGALTPSLYKACALCANWSLVLDNFTFYQNISTRGSGSGQFKPSLSLYQPHKLQALFLKQDNKKRLELPKGVPVYNLFREAHHELGFQTGLDS